VGEDVENLLLKLLRAADFDMDAAQRGIIFIDEIDKLHKTGKNVSITRDVSGEGVQQALLKLIEGNVCNIPPQGGRKHPEQQYIQMDTTNILFICGGSFTGLNEIIDKRVGGGGIGFGSKPKDDKKRKAELLQQVTQDDLEHFGMIPELMGRLPVISVLKELSQEDLKRVLVEPENALLKQYRKLARYDAANLEFTDDAVTEIAKIAFEKGLGARALRTVVEDFMMEIQFDLPEQPSNKTYVVDADVVRGKKNIFLVKGEAA
jgi:ATP-dependent Clp protease ATP-binding subunit ClpX